MTTLEQLDKDGHAFKVISSKGRQLGTVVRMTRGGTSWWQPVPRGSTADDTPVACFATPDDAGSALWVASENRKRRGKRRVGK